MPCTHCDLSGHNVQTCEIKAMKRAINIVNNYRDDDVGDDRDWFKNTSAGDSTPNEVGWWLYDVTRWHTVNGGADQHKYKSVLYCILKIKWLLFEENIPLDNNDGYMTCYGGKIKKIEVDGDIKVRWVEQLPRLSHYLNKSASETQKKKILRFLKENAERERRQQMRARQLEFENRRLQEQTRRRQEDQERQASRQRQRDEQARRAAMTEEERLTNLQLVTEAIETTECPVCMDELGNTNKVVLRCGHQFCGDCLFKHLQMPRGTNCPMCRGEYAIRPRSWLPPGAPAAAHTHAPRRGQNVAGRSDDIERQRLMRQNVETHTRLENLETLLQQVIISNSNSNNSNSNISNS